MCLAIPGRLLMVDDGDSVARTGRVDFGGVTKTVDLTLVPEARIGCYVLVHAGFALNVIDEREAEITLGYIAEMAQYDENDESDE